MFLTLSPFSSNVATDVSWKPLHTRLKKSHSYNGFPNLLGGVGGGGRPQSPHYSTMPALVRSICGGVLVAAGMFLRVPVSAFVAPSGVQSSFRWSTGAIGERHNSRARVPSTMSAGLFGEFFISPFVVLNLFFW